MSKLVTMQRCLQCGGTLIEDTQTGVFSCEYCGTQHMAPRIEISQELSEIVSRRQMREFIQAEELCREVIKKHPDYDEAYWQLLLSELGVVYVTENGQAKPTFFSYSYDERQKVKNSSSFKNAIKYAKSEEMKEFYEEKGKELDSLLEEFFSLVAKEDSYDIFISFKKSTEALVDGEKRLIDTDDYFKAREIYNFLKDKYRVFFSPVSIGADTGILGEKYEPRILKALQSSQAMILLGTKKDYLEAQWVENEWRRYRFFIDKGNKQKQSLILGYQKVMPPLPSLLKDIQLPSFDMFSVNYLKELDAKLSFVKSSNSIKSHIDANSVQTDFYQDQDTFNFGSSVQRVTISGNGEVVQVSPTEERDLRTAEDMRTNARFKDAISLSSDIIIRYPRNPQAYKCRFLSMLNIAVEQSDKNSGDGFSSCVGDFEKAIELSNDVSFSWALVDLAISLIPNTKWVDGRVIFNTVAKYIHVEDFNRTNFLLMSLQKAYEKAIKEKNTGLSEDIFSCARQLFFKENLEYNKQYTKKFACALYEADMFDAARRYFEELALVSKDAYVYMLLLASRVKTPCITKTSFKLTVNTSDDASKKKPSELDLDEILERVVLCANKHSQMNEHIRELVLYQIDYNTSNAKAFIETVASCYKQLGNNGILIDFLFAVANEYLLMECFDDAKVYFTEILAINTSNAMAHWGLLKCRTHSRYDKQLLKHRQKFMQYQEFNNARSCANSQEYEYFMSIYNGKESNAKFKETEYTTTKTVEPIKTYALLSLPVIFLFLVSFGLLAFPLTMYKIMPPTAYIVLISIAVIAAIVLYTIFMAKKHKLLYSVLMVGVFASLILMILATACPPKKLRVDSADDFKVIEQFEQGLNVEVELISDIDLKGETVSDTIRHFYKNSDNNILINGNGHAFKNGKETISKQSCKRNYDYDNGYYYSYSYNILNDYYYRTGGYYNSSADETVFQVEDIKFVNTTFTIEIPKYIEGTDAKSSTFTLYCADEIIAQVEMMEAEYNEAFNIVFDEEGNYTVVAAE